MLDGDWSSDVCSSDLRQSQQLVMTPQLQQAIKLLQM
jgi:DNA-directed RNA polymerase specialized sigma54-like protein